MSTASRTVAVATALVTLTGGSAQAADFHHVHVTASNAAEAVRWYTRNLPCEPLSDREDGIDCTGTEIVFVARPAIPEGPEHLSPWVRCITRGPIPMPDVYNNGLQIFQGPGHVVVTREMVHETRVIPTDGRPPTGADIPTYLGDPRGRWEGDTLVVDITNFNGNAPFLSSRVQGLLSSGYGSSEQLALTERYTRTGPDTLLYEFTFDDPSVWTAAWTGRYTFVKDGTQYELVEYACHEGNYGISNILTGARAKEQEQSAR